MKQVLIVDDSISARFALNRALEQHQLGVTQANSGEDALEKLDEIAAPDAIFMDHVLPGINGLEAVAQIRQRPALAQTPIIMCSSNDGEDYRQEALEGGANAVMRKPPDPAQLQAVVDQYLSGQAASDPDEVALEAAATMDTPMPVHPPVAQPEAPVSAEPPIAAERPTDQTPSPAPAATSSGADLDALDARIEKVEALLERLEQSITRMDQKVAASAKVVADQAGRDLANRLLRAVITLKGK